MAVIPVTSQPAPLPPMPPLPQEIIIGNSPPEALILGVLSVVALIVGGVILFPIIRAFARRIEGKAVDPALLSEVEQLRARVAELESVHHRVAELEERVDFSERLLSQGSREAQARGPR